MTKNEKISASKLISLALRHNPKAVGITLDRHGWADVSALLEGMNHTRRTAVTRADLQDIVKTNDKQRFAFSEDGAKIRANQGHSVRVDVGLTEKRPPDVLYHGTADRFIDSIKSEGLKPQGRLYVHLSADQETAEKVGKRHGIPVILTIDAAKMYADGYLYYLSENHVWLTEHVPPAYIHSRQSS